MLVPEALPEAPMPTRGEEATYMLEFLAGHSQWARAALFWAAELVQARGANAEGVLRDLGEIRPKRLPTDMEE